jgi:PAS domain S-box-containing protein
MMQSTHALNGATSDFSVLFRLTDRLYRARSLDDVYEAALDAIMEALGCARASILQFDEAGVMRFVAARGLSDDYKTKVTGHTPWKPGQREPEPILVRDIVETDEPDWIKAVIRQEGIRGLAFTPLVAHGGTVGKFMTYYEAPHQFSQTEKDLAITIARQVGFSIERLQSERAREIAERDLSESEERFRLMSEQAPVMIWLSDANGKCLHLNRKLREFWSLTEQDIASFDFPSVIHPDDAPSVLGAMQNAMVRREPITLTGRYRRADGAYRVLQTEAQPRVSGGVLLGMIGANIDITEREEADAARLQAEQHRELLVAELNHRVKNTLSVVQAIAHQTFRGTAEREQSAFDGRLISLARSHDLLTKSNWDNVSLHDLAASTLQAQEPMETRVSLGGPPVRLSPRQAVGLGMAFHELYTNALKYGALSNGQGRIDLRWTLEGAQLRIVWTETEGPPVAEPTHTGFGSVLLERAIRGDLGAAIETRYAPSGVVCVIETEWPHSPAG